MFRNLILGVHLDFEPTLSCIARARENEFLDANISLDPNVVSNKIIVSNKLLRLYG